MKPSRLLTFSFCLIAIASQYSCMNYYKISKAPENSSSPDMTMRANIDRYFILRNGDSAYHMGNVTNYKDSLTCRLEPLPPEHRLHLRNGRSGNMRFKKYQPEAVVLNEIHIYQTKGNAIAGEDYTLMYNNIQKIEVLEKNKTRTTISYVLGGMIIVAPFVLLGYAAALGSVYSGF